MHLSILLSIVQVGLAASSCKEYVIISTRGTNEDQGPSVAFVGMINKTLSAVPGGTEYDTLYPASDNTQGLGAADITRYITAGLEACPLQRYLLLGYSQGATATAQALQNYNATTRTAYEAIRGVLLLGNPAHKPNQRSNIDQTGGKSTFADKGILYRNDFLVPQLWYDNGRVYDICYFGDIVCVGIKLSSALGLFVPHLIYGSTPSVQQIGADFMIKMLGDVP